MPTRDEVLALTDQVQALAELIFEEKEAKREAEKANRRSNRILKVAVAVLAVLVLLLGFAAARANTAADDAKDAVGQVIAQRTESRENVCQSNKGFAEAHNKLVIGIVTQAGARPIPPDLQDEVDEQLVPVPDCTPEGIEAFYEGR